MEDIRKKFGKEKEVITLLGLENGGEFVNSSSESMAVGQATRASWRQPVGLGVRESTGFLLEKAGTDYEKEGKTFVEKCRRLIIFLGKKMK